MASKFHMPKPVCFIENRDGKLKIHREALQLLSEIHQPVVVVAIAGLYRTGKSYLMNKLAGKNSGFPLGSTVQAKTKGIQMWCVPYPGRPEQTLVLLDTEGLGDVEKGDAQNDACIFTLVILLSDILIYNTMGTIDQHAMDQLHYMSELTERIRSKSSPEENLKALDDCFFPTFIWAVRDFSLQLELNGQPCTGDEYLENALQRKEGAPEKLDLAKKYICECFLRRKCFVFDRPASRQELAHLEDLPETKLNPSFIEETQRFRSYIFETAQSKVIPGGHTMTGALLGQLAVAYVDAIHSGSIPCIENAVQALAQIENSAAVDDGVKCYEEMMECTLTLPTETAEEVLNMHKESEKKAIRVFLGRAFKDEGQVYQNRLKNQIQAKLEEICRRNEQESLNRCQGALSEVFQDMEEKIRNGSYTVLGGYKCYLEDQHKAEEKYRLTPQKGLMASMALQDFLKSKEPVALSFMKADQNLMDLQKEIEEEEALAAASQQEAELQRHLRELAQRMAEGEERSNRAREAQLTAQMVEERRRQEREHKQRLNQRLLEQSQWLTQLHQQEMARLHAEAADLTDHINHSRGRRKCVIS